jgi:broad-specificity NMP kinase
MHTATQFLYRWFCGIPYVRLHTRTVVFGSSGSGKTWFARHLAEKVGSSVVHLDEIFRFAVGFNEKRDPSDVSRLIDVRRDEAEWVVEGVYENLARQFLPSALTLVWLDLRWSVCKHRLELGGPESKAHMNRQQTSPFLLALAGCYAGNQRRYRLC